MSKITNSDIYVSEVGREDATEVVDTIGHLVEMYAAATSSNHVCYDERAAIAEQINLLTDIILMKNAKLTVDIED